MIDKILNVIYSLYFNFKYLPFSLAVKLPIIINRHVQIRMLKKDNIIVECDNLSFGMIHLGINKGSFCLAKKISSIYIEKNCKLVFNGNCTLSPGFYIVINHG